VKKLNLEKRRDNKGRKEKPPKKKGSSREEYRGFA